MTPKQIRFVDEYIATGNAAEAARRAGYSERTARVIGEQNLTKLYIREAIEARMKELAAERLMKMQDAQEYLAAAIRGLMTETVVTPNGKKVEAPLKAADRLRALDMYFKIQGAYREKMEVQMSGGELLKRTLEKIWNE